MPEENEFNEQVEAATAPLREEIEALKSQLEPKGPEDNRPAWQRDPTWKPKSSADLAEEIKKDLRNEGIGEMDVDKITETVMQKMQERQETQKTEEQKRIEEADKQIEEEIAAVKKEDENVDTEAVFKFAKEWNKDHASKIYSFKDAYDMMQMKNGGNKESKRGEHELIGGSSGGDEGEASKIKRGTRPDDVVSSVIQRFQDAG